MPLPSATPHALLWGTPRGALSVTGRWVLPGVALALLVAAALLPQVALAHNGSLGVEAVECDPLCDDAGCDDDGADLGRRCFVAKDETSNTYRGWRFQQAASVCSENSGNYSSYQEDSVFEVTYTRREQRVCFLFEHKHGAIVGRSTTHATANADEVQRTVVDPLQAPDRHIGGDYEVSFEANRPLGITLGGHIHVTSGTATNLQLEDRQSHGDPYRYTFTMMPDSRYVNNVIGFSDVFREGVRRNNALQFDAGSDLAYLRDRDDQPVSTDSPSARSFRTITVEPDVRIAAPDLRLTRLRAGIRLDWSAPASEIAISKYEIWHRNTSESSPGNRIATLLPGDTSHIHPRDTRAARRINGRLAGGEGGVQYYRVVALGPDGGRGEISAWKSAAPRDTRKRTITGTGGTTGLLLDDPPLIGNRESTTGQRLTVAQNRYGILVSWEPPEGIALTRYEIRRSCGTATSRGRTVGPFIDVDADQSSYFDTDIGSCSRYYYRVSGYTRLNGYTVIPDDRNSPPALDIRRTADPEYADWQHAGANVPGTVHDIPAPRTSGIGVTASAEDIRVIWNQAVIPDHSSAESIPFISGYEVWRSATGGSDTGIRIAEVEPPETYPGGYRDQFSNLEGREYYYRVFAFSAGGKSAVAAWTAAAVVPAVEQIRLVDRDGPFYIASVIGVRLGFVADIVVTPPTDMADPVTLTLSLDSGNVDAVYRASESGSNFMFFDYTVQPGDNDEDGFTIGDDAVDLKADGRIADAATESADAIFPLSRSRIQNSTLLRVATSEDRQVDTTTRPLRTYLIEDGPFLEGHVIRIAMEFARITVEIGTGIETRVVATGNNIALAILLSSGTVHARIAPDDTSVTPDTLVFNYTVQSTDRDASGFDIGDIVLNGGEILDESRFAVSTTVPESAKDTTLGAVGAVLADREVNGGRKPGSAEEIILLERGPFALGEQIALGVRFSENLRISGTPKLEITLDSGLVVAERFTPASAQLSGIPSPQRIVYFGYTVQPGDLDADGFEIADAISPLDTPAGERIINSSGRNVLLSLGDAALIGKNAGVALETAHTSVDGGPGYLGVSSIRVQSPGPYYTGDTITLVLAFDDREKTRDTVRPVTVTGSPVLQVVPGDDDEKDRTPLMFAYDRTEEGFPYFSYTVEKGDKDNNSFVVGDFVLVSENVLAGGSIADTETTHEVLSGSLADIRISLVVPPGEPESFLPDEQRTINPGTIDIDGGGGVDVVDAELLLHTYTTVSDLQNTPHATRVAIFGLPDGEDVAAQEAALINTFHAANALEFDLNDDDMTDSRDAAAFYYSFALEASLGDGSPGRPGIMEIKRIILGPLTADPGSGMPQMDENIDAMLQEAHKRRGK